MSEFTAILNAIEPEAWAGIAGLAAGISAAFFAAFKGIKRHPVEVGLPAPECDRTEYVLEEVRGSRVILNNLVDQQRGNRAILKEIIGRLDRIEDDTEALRRDTAVLLAQHH